jgi:hypothetical protein
LTRPRKRVRIFLSDKNLPVFKEIVLYMGTGLDNPATRPHFFQCKVTVYLVGFYSMTFISLLSILVLGWLKLSKFPWNKITLEGVFQMGIIPLLCYKFFLNSFVLRFIIQRRFPFFRRFYISFLLHVFSLRVQYAKKIISDQKNTTMIGKIPNHIWMMNLRV